MKKGASGEARGTDTSPQERPLRKAWDESKEEFLFRGAYQAVEQAKDAFNKVAYLNNHTDADKETFLRLTQEFFDHASAAIVAADGIRNRSKKEIAKEKVLGDMRYVQGWVDKWLPGFTDKPDVLITPPALEPLKPVPRPTQESAPVISEFGNSSFDRFLRQAPDEGEKNSKPKFVFRRAFWGMAAARNDYRAADLSGDKKVTRQAVLNWLESTTRALEAALTIENKNESARAEELVKSERAFALEIMDILNRALADEILSTVDGAPEASGGSAEVLAFEEANRKMAKAIDVYNVAGERLNKDKTKAKYEATLEAAREFFDSATHALELANKITDVALKAKAVERIEPRVKSASEKCTYFETELKRLFPKSPAAEASLSEKAALAPGGAEGFQDPVYHPAGGLSDLAKDLLKPQPPAPDEAAAGGGEGGEDEGVAKKSWKFEGLRLPNIGELVKKAGKNLHVLGHPVGQFLIGAGIGAGTRLAVQSVFGGYLALAGGAAGAAVGAWRQIEKEKRAYKKSYDDLIERFSKKGQGLPALALEVKKLRDELDGALEGTKRKEIERMQDNLRYAMHALRVFAENKRRKEAAIDPNRGEGAMTLKGLIEKYVYDAHKIPGGVEGHQDDRARFVAEILSAKKVSLGKLGKAVAIGAAVGALGALVGGEVIAQIQAHGGFEAAAEAIGSQIEALKEQFGASIASIQGQVPADIGPTVDAGPVISSDPVNTNPAGAAPGGSPVVGENIGVGPSIEAGSVVTELTLEKGSNPWDAMEAYLISQGIPDPTNAQILELTKQVALDSNIGVEDWGVQGEIDSRSVFGQPVNVGDPSATPLRITAVAQELIEAMKSNNN